VASPSDPPTGRAGDTEQFPVARTDAAPADGPAHAVGSDSGSGVTRGGWWAITIAAAVLLILGFLLTFGPARYWTPVPVVFLGYCLISGLIGLVFWKGVRELRDSNPTLRSGDGPASPGARVAAAIGAVGVASALILLPAGLSDAPASAAPCPDGSNTCGPQPTMGPQPTQGNGGNTTAPQAPNTTVPGYTPPDTPPQQGNGSTPTVQGQVPTMPTGDTPSNGCIFNCGPTQAQQAPQTGQATPPQTGQNPVTTAPNTPATTPQAPTTTPRLRTPTPETTTSTTSSKARDRDDDQQRSSDEDREKNSPYPYQAALFSAVGGTYRRKKISESAVRSGRVVSKMTYTKASDERSATDPRGPRREGDGDNPAPPANPGDATTTEGASVPPPPPWTQKDPSTPRSTQPIISRGDDVAKKAAIEAVLPEFESTMPHAADHMRHFLGNSGTPYTLDVKSMLEVKEFNDAVTKKLRETALAKGRQMIAEGKTGPVGVRSAWDGFTMFPQYSKDWWYASGSIDYSVGAIVRVLPGNVIEISDAQLDVRDFYNWDGGKSTELMGVTITDKFLQDLVTAGLAAEFLTSGASPLPGMTVPL